MCKPLNAAKITDEGISSEGDIDKMQHKMPCMMKDFLLVNNFYSGQQLKFCTTFAAIIRTSKHFWLLQCI